MLLLETGSHTAQGRVKAVHNTQLFTVEEFMTGQREWY